MVKLTDTAKQKKEGKTPIEQSQENDNESFSSSSSSSEDEMMEGLSDLEEEVNEKQHTIKKLNPHKKKNKNKDEQEETTPNGKGKKNTNEYSSIIYVSRLPNGFYEKELSKYFSQFGDLKEVRLARNKKTGNSRHYGFIEFSNKDDAKIAQETMNNYLLMGHLLQVRLMEKGSKIEKLYKYKKRSFNENKIKKNKKEIEEASQIRHKERMDKLKESGIDFKW